MEHLSSRIEFYRQRSFSEKLNVVFGFIRENWKPLLKYSFYLIMPVCLIQSFAMNSFFTIYFNALMDSGGSSLFGYSLYSFFVNYGILMLCIMVGSGVMSGLIYAMMQTYAVRENKLQDVTLNDFKGLLVKNTSKYIRLMLAIFFAYALIAFVMGLLAAFVSTWSLVITIPILLVCTLCLIPLMLIFPTYIFERDITFFSAFKKAWKLGIATFGGMIGLMFVLYFISSAIQTITMMPWYLTTIISSMFVASSESMMNPSVTLKFVLYLLGLLQSYGMYMATTIGIIGLAFQYFHAREKVEGVTIESNISNFDKL
jgi:hypothetical protein